MKKLALFILFAGFLTTGFAQKQSYAQKASKEKAAYVAEHMSLKKNKATFLEGVLLNKYESVSKEVKAAGSDISQEDKKAIYKKSNKKMMADLSQEFSKEEISRIKKLLKEQKEKRRKE